MSEQILSEPALLPLFPFDAAPSVEIAPELARLRAEDPVCRVRLATGREAWLVTRYDDVRTVLSGALFSRASNQAPGMAAPQRSASGAPAPGQPAPVSVSMQDAESISNLDPPEHTRIRDMAANAFSAELVGHLRPRATAAVDELLDAMAEQGPSSDLVTSFADPLAATLMCELFGIPAENRAELRGWLDDATAVTGPSPQQRVEAMRRASECLLDLAARKRLRPQHDLLTGLVRAHAGEDRLSDREVLMMVFITFVGGNHTTSVQLSKSVLALFRHPGQLALAVAKPEVVPNAVEELMRFVPLGPGAFARTAVTDIELSGVAIPAGETILPSTAAANRDPAVFADPERLDITRPNARAHLQLGGGVHACIGQALARMELQIALGGLLSRFPTLRLAVPETDLAWETERQGEWDLDHIITLPRALPVAW
jgi:cytochrome P450